MIRNFLIENFPSLGRYKRFGKAWYDHIQPGKESYSQHREDVFIWKYLQRYDLKGSMYVDVGANHPSDISNSYLLYRHGLQGVVIEPNLELIKLFERFRKRDIALAIGCSNINTVLPFHISKTPVLSSFATNNREGTRTFRTRYLPVMQLDLAIAHIPLEFISLLSIDVEGLNLQVLQGAREIVKKALMICLEFDTENDKQEYLSILGPDFGVVREFGCNLILVNQPLEARISRKETA
ncbi:MAG TPA: FkbM family methyltransferase [Puia sp.]|nr:FkbM family methyltransferase [Puia sp.]